MFDGLPASSCCWQPENNGWTINDHLLATLIEFQHGTTRAVVAPYVKRQPKPFMYPRPGAKKKNRKVSPLEFMRMMQEVSND